MLHLKITPIYDEKKKEILYRIEDLHGFFYVFAKKLFIDDISIENYNLKQGDFLLVTALVIEAKGIKDDRDKGTAVAEEVSIKTIYTIHNAIIETLSDFLHK
jgi:hypothetical protein